MEPSSDPKSTEEKRFIALAVDELDRARADSRFDRLVLVAPAKAMGLFRAAIKPPLADLVSAELTKDLIHTPLEALPGHLGDVLAV